MTWMMLAVPVVVLVVLAVTLHGWSPSPSSRSGPLPGVEGVRKLRRQTRAALDAASTMLR